MRKKKILSVILSLVMILTALPLTAVSSFAADDTIYTSGDWSYRILDDGTAEIYAGYMKNAYSGSEANLTIPSKIDGYTVTSIGDFAFFCNSVIENVIIPNTITKIGERAFAFLDTIGVYGEYSNLKHIDIPDSVLEIGSGAFFFSALESLTYPVNAVVEDGAFMYTKITSLTIPEGVKVIPKNVFSYCSKLEAVVIPESATRIEDGAFEGCFKLIIYGYAGSTAERYAKENDIKFVSLTNNTSLYAKSIIDYIKTSYVVDDYIITLPAEYFNVFENIFSEISISENQYNLIMDILHNLFDYLRNNNIESIEDIVNTNGAEDIIFDYMNNAFNVIGYRTIMEGSLNDSNHGLILIVNPNGIVIAKLHPALVKVAANEPVNFPDVSKNDWFYVSVQFNVQMGYFKGYGDGTFGPANNIQRQDFVVVLARIAGVDLSTYEGQNGGMSDVPKNDYYSAAVAWAVDNNIITGYKNGKFGVGDPITREQACAIFYRYVVINCGGDGSLSASSSSILARFGDRNKISDWAVTNVAWAVDKGVISGTQSGNVNPAGNANRAEISKILMNMSNNGLI